MNQQPERGTILECQSTTTLLLVLGDCEYVSCHLKIKGVQLMNLDTGEIEVQRRSLDWWNWYFHPTGWDELK
jgi:hypothetical protein